VSAPESGPLAAAGGAVRIAACPTDCIELAAFSGRAAALTGIAAERGLPLPAFGHVAHAAGQLVLSVRPQRWLVLSAPQAAGAAGALWHSACAGVGAAIDLSSAQTALHLAGPDAADRKSTRLNSSHLSVSRMPSSA